MQLKKSEQRMLIILSAVIVAGLIYQLTNKKEKPKTIITSKSISSVNKSVNSEKSPITSHIKTDHRENQYDHWGKNPFDVFSRGKEKTYSELKSSLNLKGILWKQGKPYAIINDYILTTGGVEGGIRVVSITENRVVCQFQGSTFTLEWKG